MSRRKKDANLREGHLRIIKGWPLLPMRLQSRYAWLFWIQTRLTKTAGYRKPTRTWKFNGLGPHYLGQRYSPINKRWKNLGWID